MAVPVKTLADTRVSTSSDSFTESDPHVTAWSKGGFAIAYNNPGAGDVDAAVTLFESDGSVLLGTHPVIPDADDTQASWYGLGDGTFITTWTHTPHASGDADIQARFFSPELA